MPTAIIEFTWPGIAWPQETLRCRVSDVPQSEKLKCEKNALQSW